MASEVLHRPVPDRYAPHAVTVHRGVRRPARNCHQRAFVTSPAWPLYDRDAQPQVGSGSGGRQRIDPHSHGEGARSRRRPASCRRGP